MIQIFVLFFSLLVIVAIFIIVTGLSRTGSSGTHSATRPRRNTRGSDQSGDNSFMHTAAAGMLLNDIAHSGSSHSSHPGGSHAPDPSSGDMTGESGPTDLGSSDGGTSSDLGSSGDAGSSCSGGSSCSSSSSCSSGSSCSGGSSCSSSS